MAFNNIDSGQPRKIKMARGIKSAMGIQGSPAGGLGGSNPFEDDQYNGWNKDIPNLHSRSSLFDQACRLNFGELVPTEANLNDGRTKFSQNTYLSSQIGPRISAQSAPSQGMGIWNQPPLPSHWLGGAIASEDPGLNDSHHNTFSHSTSRKLDMTDTRDSTLHSRNEQKYSILNSMTKSVRQVYLGPSRKIRMV